MVHSVTGPCGQPVSARYLSAGDTAYVELAEAAGLQHRLPGFSAANTTTFGAGQLIGEALNAGHRHIALNPFFFESGVRIEALCDVTNPLCGPNGSARVFGPQKGATPEMVETMEAGMAHLATIFERNKGPKLADMPCAGAAGGCGAGVVAFLNGRLLSGSDALLDLMNFSALAADADLIVTGEGMVDDQTAGGKFVSAVAARANGTPVVVLAGGIAEGTNLEALYEKGVTAVMPVTSRPMTLGEAMSSGAEGVRLTATQLFRLAGALKA